MFKPAQITALPAAPETKSFADVLSAVDACSDFSPARRKDLKCAVRTLCRLVGRRPDGVPADPARVRELIRGFHPIRIGMSSRRWANIKAAVNTALTLVGINARRRIYRPLRDPRWQTLWTSLPRDLHRRHRLSRLVRFCDNQGLAPEAITDDVLIRFRDHLDRVSLTGDPMSTVGETAIGWNRAAETVPGWPQVVLTAPSRRASYVLPISTFPSSFRDDLERWMRRMRGDDPLDDKAPVRPLRPATLASRRLYILSFAAALVHRGREPSTLTSLADLVSAEAFKSALLFFHVHHGNRWTPHAHNIAKCMTAVAEHYVEAEGRHLETLKAHVRKLRPARRGMTEKNRARLRQLDDPRTVDRFLALPKTLVRAATRATTSPRAAARAVMRAVAIELLTFCALRLRNLADLELDRHFVDLDGARHGPVLIVIPPGETKNEEELSFELSSGSSRLLRLYLDRYRPLLLRDPANRSLFPGRGLGAYKPSSLSRAIKKTAFRESGIDITTHNFRHFVGKLFLDRHPGRYEIVRRLLGHRDIRTTVEYYTGQEAAAAVRHVASTLLGIRDKAGRPHPLPRPRRAWSDPHAG